MDRIEGLAFYNFSRQNKFLSDYNLAYKRALQAQNEVIKCENSPYSSATELQKWKNDLKRWSKKTEDIFFRAKAEENQLFEKNNNGLGGKLNFLA